MMIKRPDHYPLEQGGSAQPCGRADCVLRHDACKCCGEHDSASVGQSYRRRGLSIVPSALCHIMKPCTERNAAL
eukprot:1903628-Alexandrium_andersonii.AAC.1